MDEVDNIIIHSLRQIGCNIDEDAHSLANLTPENLVESVSKCLQMIQPDVDVPKALPPGIAQRYSVTTSLAEACASIGFRGDIGYQTFLYSNVTEVRRVFMFLIERLPKESDGKSGGAGASGTASFDAPAIDKRSILENSLVRNVDIQVNAAWTPQYCKTSGVREFGNLVAIQASSSGFLPQNLNVPHTLSTNASNELRKYWLKRSPTIFQQTRSNTICASMIHKNDIDCETSRTTSQRISNFQKLLQLNKLNGGQSATQLKREHIRNVKSIQQLTLNNIELPHANDIVAMPEISESDAIRFDIEKIKAHIEQALSNRQKLQDCLDECNSGRQTVVDAIAKLRSERKVAERTNLLLENPDVNLSKMEKVLSTTQERIGKLRDQWNEHRQPMMQQLDAAKQSSTQKYSQTKQIMDQIKSMRDTAEEITGDLKRKTVQHAQLIGEFEKNNRCISRSAYTSRILEIIGNIKKQKMDIDKIIADTRDLQKEINVVNGQLDRQFTVTDDLLFKNAKRDEAAKKAYKLLATLHTECADLIQMVQDTGIVQREIRDLEDQIEIERDRNITANLEQITNDLRILNGEADDIQQRINAHVATS